MKKHLFWILPSIIIAAGIINVFYQNITNVAEPPAANWSRALHIGTTTVDNKLPVQVTEDGTINIQTYEDEQLRIKTLTKDFETIEEKSYDIPYDKWTQVYLQGDTLIYHDYNHIYDQEGNIIVSDASRFYPLKDTILYIKENALYELAPADNSTQKLMDLEKGIEDIIPYQGEQGLYFMTENSLNNEVELNVYNVNSTDVEYIHQEQFTLDFGQVVNHIDFVINGENLAFTLETEQKQSQGAPVFYTYFKETAIGGSEGTPLQQLEFDDPVGDGSLSEVAGISVKYQDGKPHFLFRASGNSQTQFKGRSAFNIYAATMSDSGHIDVSRKSNTPEISSKPQWLNDETVAWLDMEGDENVIYVSSGNPEIIDKASSLTQDDWIRALGKTLGMLSVIAVTISISSIWFVWPVLFIVVVYFLRGRIVEEDPAWLFYTGIGIYMLAVFFFKEYIFVPSVYANAPSYLTFNGSSIVYILLFAVIAFIAAQSTKKTRGWQASGRIACFAGAHILMVLSVFGPYFI
ncbi:hypothetical protein [Virgibacillus doumboii]|uniref:hypothetical protein n=1 Tax=Virgibacillus doumboii TaxID=2697503 RepID=UPI0013DEFF82|nr:hypothetical protein [Virgibacillus doumboii]